MGFESQGNESSVAGCPDEKERIRIFRERSAAPRLARVSERSTLPNGYLAALRNAPGAYMDGAEGLQVAAVQVDGQILPLVINPGSNRNATLWSPYAHYYCYTLQEFGRRHARVTSACVQAGASPLGAALRMLEFDKTVIANNWLFACGPNLHLSSEQIRFLTGQIATAYPQSTIIFRPVNTMLDQKLGAAFLANGYRLVRSRRTHIINGGGGEHLRKYDTRHDLKLLRNPEYEIVSGADALEKHASRMAELYRKVYLEKYSRLNTAFNAEFFRLTLKENVLTYRGWVRDGRLDAFVGYFIGEDLVSGAIIGHDHLLARKFGLYRAAIALLISEATERKLPLNLGGGAGKLKILRGAVPVEEFEAVYDRHLPPGRRLPWRALEMAGRLQKGVQQVQWR